ncbi:MAG: pyridoxamine 5'-phosphate oxidase [Gammaproteobacteria bacterium]
MDLYAEAIARFRTLFDAARATDLPEPAAMSLATASTDGRPAVRTVLLKHVDERGFVFYTNAGSRKGEQIQDNPRAALCFYWQPLAQQVLVEGAVAAVSAAESDAYWVTRLRQSQLGAWASRQSQLLTGRTELEERVAFYEKRFADGPVPRPDYWHGFRVAPDLLEFWVSRPGRLHVRDRYYREQDVWKHTLIYP